MHTHYPACCPSASVERRRLRRARFVRRPIAAAIASLMAGGVGAQAPAPGQVFLPGTVVGSQVWSNASVQSFTPGELVIRQTAPRAQLHWDRLNIDVGETVRFNQQGNRDWVALNWIADRDPTRIAGRLIADGQVYLINQNGIVFRPGAQIDAASFIASTLQINQDAFQRGLTALRDPNLATFQAFAGAPADARIEVQSGAVTRLDGTPVLTPGGAPLQAIASIRAGDSGRVFLLATQEVVNSGLVQSPSGQVVLAAGQRIYVYAPAAGADASFRGLLIELDSGGTARNLGSILTPQGNTTLIARSVNQAGRISADTAISGNGSVWLLARSDTVVDPADPTRRIATGSGDVTLAAGSETVLRPVDRVSSTSPVQTALDSQRVFPSQVRIEGATVHLQGSAAGGGARIEAPGGEVTVRAVDSPAAASSSVPNGLAPTGLLDNGAATPRRVLVDDGVRIDVSGLRDVAVDAARNVLEVDLRGEVVADNPVLRASPLAGATVRIDIRQGTPLISASALNTLAANRVRRTMSELSTVAGAVRLLSDGDVIVNPGAQFDLRGGSVRLTPSTLGTTLVTDGLRVVDISQATPDRAWRAVDRFSVTDPRWGVTETIASGFAINRDPGSLSGANAGWLELNAGLIAMSGQLDAATVIGSGQREAPPTGGRITFGERFGFRDSALAPITTTFRLTQPIVFGRNNAAPTSWDLGSDRAAVWGDPAAPAPLRIDSERLVAQGVSRIEALTNAELTIDASQAVRLPVGGTFTAAGRSVDVRADIVVPGARDAVVAVGTGADQGRSIVSRGIDLSAQPGPAVDLDAVPVGVRIAAGVTVSAAGQWRAEDRTRLDPNAQAPAVALSGGTVRLRSPREVVAEAGSTIDVSAGAALDRVRGLRSGTGGSIEIAGGDAGGVQFPAVGRVVLDGRLDGHAPFRGGRLRIDAPAIAVGSSASPGALRIDPALFGTAGFASIDLRGQDRLVVEDGTRIVAVQTNLIIDPTLATELARDPSAANTDRLRAAATLGIRPELDRTPVTVALRAPSRARGELRFGSGAELSTDVGGSLSLDAGAWLGMFGTLTAPAGTIALTLGSATAYNGYRGAQNLFVGPQARLQADGVERVQTDGAGRVSGTVLPAGTLRLAADEGNVIVSPTAQLLARGARTTVQAVREDAPGVLGSVALGSAGGTLDVRVLNGGQLSGTVDLRGGGAGARDGTVRITGIDTRAVAGELFDGAVPLPADPQTLGLHAGADALVVSGVSPTDARIDWSAAAGTPGGPRSRNDFRIDGRVFAQPLSNVVVSGRDTVSARGGGITSARESVTVSAPLLEVDPGATLRIEAPVVSVGNARLRASGAPNPPPSNATGGTGSVDVRAGQLLEVVGTAFVQGASRVTLSSGGDLRARGVFRPRGDGIDPFAFGALTTAGELRLEATRIYPTTLTSFAFAATGAGSSLTLAPGAGIGPSAPPLSAGGELRFAADTVEHRTTVEAPLGRVTFDAASQLRIGAGSVTQVSAADRLIPFGETLDGRQINYTFSAGQVLDVRELPKEIAFRGPAIAIEGGARVDASGGGDVLAASFVSRGGIGAAGDLLARSNVFAIVPGYAGALPEDFRISADMRAQRGELPGTSASAAHRGAMPSSIPVAPIESLQPGDSLRFAGNGALPAGVYTLLPARYALLPGALAVAVTGQRLSLPAVAQSLADGSTLQSAQRVNVAGGSADPLWTTVNVIPGSVVRDYSEYVIDSGNRSFALRAAAAGTEAAVRLPQDAGRVAFTATGASLSLQGTVALDGGRPLDAAGTPGAATGRRGELTVAAERLAVIAPGASAPGGAVALDAQRLSAFEAERLVLGGSQGSDGALTAVAREVDVAAGALLQAGEVILVATDRIGVATGAQVSASASRAATPVSLSAPAAVVALEGPSATADRPLGPLAGRVELGAGAQLAAATARIGAGSAGLSPQARVDAGRQGYAFDQIVVGDGSGAAGTRLDDAFLAGSSPGLRELAFGAAQSFAVRGTARFGGTALERFVLTAPRIDGSAGTLLRIEAAQVRLQGVAGVTPGAPQAGGASLEAIARGTTAAPARIEFGDGALALDGFSNSRFTASGPAGGEVRFAGQGSLAASGSVAMEAARVVTGDGNPFAVAVADRFDALSTGTAPTARAGFGGRLSIEAAGIGVSSAIALPSGQLWLTATGPQGLVLDAGSNVSVAGAQATIGSRTVAADAGSANLVATVGDVDVRAGARLDASAADGQTRAGDLLISAQGGRVIVNGTLAATSSRGSVGPSGAIEIDARTLEAPGALLQRASQAGDLERLTLRQRAGDLQVTGVSSQQDIASAGHVALTADAGDLSIGPGRLTSSGVAGANDEAVRDGGSVRLSAGNRILLADGTTLAARSVGGLGGRVDLNGRAGTLASGAVVLDVGGAAPAQGGIVDVRVPRSAEDAQFDLRSAEVRGIRDGGLTVTAFERYLGVDEVLWSGASSGSVLALADPAAGGALSRATAFMNNVTTSGARTAAQIAARAPSAARVRPEIEVVGGAGAVRVSEHLDFSTVRFNGTAGVLTVRSAGDLVVTGTTTGTQASGVRAAVNDGFGGATGSAAAGNTAQDATFVASATDHWSFRFVAGADTAAADALSVRQPIAGAAGTGSFRLLANRLIRTGVGEVEVRAADDVLLGVQAATGPGSESIAATGQASILTVGRTAPAVANFTVPSATVGFPASQRPALRPLFTERGGDVSVVAGGDVRGLPAGDILSGWLFRWGTVDATTDRFVQNRNVAWWARPDLFTQSLGALGGGDLTVRAGGALANVSASIATSGRLAGTNPSTATLVVSDGGRLEARAGLGREGGDLTSGSFSAMRGEVRIASGDAIGSSRTTSTGERVFPVAGLGDARLEAFARTDLVLDRVYNPTLAPIRLVQSAAEAPRANALTFAQATTFSTYGERTRVRATSAAGDAKLVATNANALFNASGLTDSSFIYTGRELPFSAMPGEFALTSLVGDIVLSDAPRSPTGTGSVSTLQFFPDPQGQLDFVAGRDIVGHGALLQGDADVVTKFNVRRPTVALAASQAWTQEFVEVPSQRLTALEPVHAADPAPSRFVAGRDIRSTPTPAEPTLGFFTAEPAIVEAGRDIVDLTAALQNVRPGDVSVVRAGRDIDNRIAVSPTNALVPNPAGILVAGPGAVEVIAGRNIGMGTSQGIVTRGNLGNAALPEAGARILVQVGLPAGADYPAFLGRYVDPGSSDPRAATHGAALVDYVGRFFPGEGFSSQGLTPAQLAALAPAAWARFQTLGRSDREQFARDVFFTELRTGGAEAADPRSSSFGTAQRAYDAMRALFGAGGAGNIDLVFSQVKTERGGGIQILAPGLVCPGAASACAPTEASRATGNVFAGLTNPPSTLQAIKAPSDLGVLTIGGGAIEAFTGSDFAVNQSRVLTGGGGDITMFSALGNIDAGRGARSAVSTPPPLVRVDRNGNVVVELPGVLEGSGIGVIQSRPDVPVGNVFLFAPKGILDAGEAGIRSSGNVVVFASQVLNASAIVAGGASVGVPAAAASVNLGGLSASTTGAVAAGAAAGATTGSTADGPRAQRQRSVLLVVDFLGFGDEGEEAYKRRRAASQRR